MKTKQLLHFIPKLGVANLIHQDEDQAVTPFQPEFGSANIIHQDKEFGSANIIHQDEEP